MIASDRPDTGARRDRGRRAITRMCIARRADKLDAAIEATNPARIAYRAAQRDLVARRWWSDFALVWVAISGAMELIIYTRITTRETDAPRSPWLTTGRGGTSAMDCAREEIRNRGGRP